MRAGCAIALVGLAVACGGPGKPANESRPESAAAPEPAGPSRSVDDFRGADMPDGDYVLTGYVLGIDSPNCPPCANPAACGPCGRGAIVIADRDRVDDPGRLEIASSTEVPETLLHRPVRVAVRVSHAITGVRSVMLIRVTPAR